MRILVLDSIHGGMVIKDFLDIKGHKVDLVDIYRGKIGISEEDALKNQYDLVIHPVHCDPAHPLLKLIPSPAISHHEAVRWLWEQDPYAPMRKVEIGKSYGALPIRSNRNGLIIEITGARGKTTTAHALAHILTGPGLLHTTAGMVRYPERALIRRASITPASLLTAISDLPNFGWFVAEVSLGFCGIGVLGILTSGDDYKVANGRRSALQIKMNSAFAIRSLLLPPGLVTTHDASIAADELVTVEGDCCIYNYRGFNGRFSNPLLKIPAYQTPLLLAAAAALLFGIRPDTLATFTPLDGRLKVEKTFNGYIIDNANSGASESSSVDAIKLGRELIPDAEYVLVIGQESASVCENFETLAIIKIINDHKPALVILIAGDPRIDKRVVESVCLNAEISFLSARSREEAINRAGRFNLPLIVVTVKTWR